MIQIEPNSRSLTETGYSALCEKTRGPQTNPQHSGASVDAFNFHVNPGLEQGQDDVAPFWHEVKDISVSIDGSDGSVLLWD